MLNACGWSIEESNPEGFIDATESACCNDSS